MLPGSEGEEGRQATGPERRIMLRMQQRKNERPDIFAMRAFVKALPLLKKHEAYAAVKWMLEITVDPKTWLSKISVGPSDKPAG